MPEIQPVALLVQVCNTYVLVLDMTSYGDDKLAACHVKFLSTESIPFCKGGSIIMGRVKVGVLHMQSFQDSKVTKANVNHISTLFLQSSQKAASFWFEFLHDAQILTVCLEMHT